MELRRAATGRRVGRQRTALLFSSRPRRRHGRQKAKEVNACGRCACRLGSEIVALPRGGATGAVALVGSGADPDRGCGFVVEARKMESDRERAVAAEQRHGRGPEVAESSARRRGT